MAYFAIFIGTDPSLRTKGEPSTSLGLARDVICRWARNAPIIGAKTATTAITIAISAPVCSVVNVHQSIRTPAMITASIKATMLPAVTTGFSFIIIFLITLFIFVDARTGRSRRSGAGESRLGSPNAPVRIHGSFYSLAVAR